MAGAVRMVAAWEPEGHELQVDRVQSSRVARRDGHVRGIEVEIRKSEVPQGDQLVIDRSNVIARAAIRNTATAAGARSRAGGAPPSA